VIGDLVKTRVYAVCRWINRDSEVIPRTILEKPPSAELRPDQKDTDSLPPYEVLDPILEAYVERYETPNKSLRHTDFLYSSFNRWCAWSNAASTNANSPPGSEGDLKVIRHGPQIPHCRQSSGIS